jgi:hypothetical protein
MCVKFHSGRIRRMRRCCFVVVVAIITSVMVVPAMAWEFTLKGDWEWRYRYWARTGDRDIFGTVDPVAVNLGVNHLNTFPTTGTQNRGGATFGVLAGENNFGSDMSFTDYRVTLYPGINVNKAIDVKASVNLTSLGIWSDGEPLVSGPGAFTAPTAGTHLGYINSLYVPISDRPAAINVPNTYVTLQWLAASIKTPMLDFSLGYKTSKLGMGLWKHASTRASASFGVKAYYGPITIGFSPYFSRRLSEWASVRSRNEGDEAQSRKERVRNYFGAIMAEITYKSGPLEIQFASDSYREEGAPETDSRGAAITPGRPSLDTIRYRFHLSFDYFNGKFFTEGEADAFYRWRSGRQAANAAGTRVEQDIDQNGWIYGLQIGYVTGPSKITLNYVRATGDDPSTRETNEDAREGEAGVSNGYIKNWGFLMYHLYGTGTNFNTDGYGQPTNFHHLGGRVDYGLAANLNIWAVYAYAWRDQPQAYRLGGSYALGLERWRNENLRLAQLGALDRPVPDSARDIGWEVDFGVNWQILDRLTWNTLFAYWQPGTWWSFAYPNTANIYRTNGGAAIGAGNRQLAIFGAGREIDPLIAIETNLVLNF